jgi:hypothetical protein
MSLRQTHPDGACYSPRVLVRAIATVSVLAAALVAGCGKTSRDTAGSETGDPTGNGGSGGTETTAGSGGSDTTSGGSGGAAQSGSGGLDGSAGSDGPGGSAGSAGSAAAAGAAGGGGMAVGQVPTMFRITNQSETTVYIDSNLAVRCSDLDPGAEGACQFFPFYCMMGCDGLEPGSDCCILCEREIPNTLRLDPGQGHELEWDGTIFTRNDSYCSACSCQDSGPIPDGNYEALVTAYETWRCDGFDPCVEGEDSVIEWAVPSGNSTEFVVVFSIPSSTAVVQIDIMAG